MDAKGPGLGIPHEPSLGSGGRGSDTSWKFQVFFGHKGVRVRLGQVVTADDIIIIYYASLPLPQGSGCNLDK